ncbi:MAG: hypothetical protein R8K46_10110 [Mariprofundaceae bacterium]
MLRTVFTLIFLAFIAMPGWAFASDTSEGEVTPEDVAIAESGSGS